MIYDLMIIYATFVRQSVRFGFWRSGAGLAPDFGWGLAPAAGRSY